MKIGVISSDIREIGGTMVYGGAVWYRAILPLSFAASHGCHWVVGKDGAIDDGIWIRQRDELFRPDIILCPRAQSDITYQALLAAKKAGQRVVIDLDDNIWNIPSSNAAHKLSVWSGQEGLQWLVKQVEIADSVVISTNYLADSFYDFARKKLGKKTAAKIPITVVENMIDCSVWQEHPFEPGPKIGWTGSIAHRDIELRWIVEVLSSARRFGFEPVHVGIGELPGVKSYGPYMAPDWHRSAEHFNIGLAAVADSAFSRCKSDIKVLEYAAAGKPFIAYGYPYRKWADIGIVLENPNQIQAALYNLRYRAYQEQMSAQVLEHAKTRDIRYRWQEFARAWGVIE